MKKMSRDIRKIRRYTKRGKIFGVCAGLAIWADLEVEKFQTIVFLVVLFTGFFPGAIIYLVLALLIPAYDQHGANYGYDRYSNEHPYEDSDDDRSNEDLKAEYENLKHKVEKMENEMFDKERDWDKRFHEE
jgi:phage shock protein C